MTAREIFEQSDGAVTTRYYADLARLGHLGFIALNLFRAQKCSSRAKKYRGGIRGVGSYRGLAYERKGWSLKQLADALVQCGAEFGIGFGWGVDDSEQMNSWVFYIDLPQGQISFHSPVRYAGPEYPGQWDRQHASEKRILDF